MAQSRRPPQDDHFEGTLSPCVKLVDAVLRLQKDMEEFRAESGYGSAGRQATPVQTSGRHRFTSAPVPRYAGRSSWDQYQHVFEAIVCSNGWDEVAAALQLVAHLEGDAFNVALLVPKSQRVLPGVLVGALSEHYGSPGRLAKYRRQFERVSRSPGDDPSVIAIEVETLARRAFVDVDDSVCLQLVRDKFIEGQAECSLRRHLDSVGPDTPIEDIVDRCRVWESHTEDMNKWEIGRKSDRPRAVSQVASVGVNSRLNDASADKDVLGELMSHLLPKPAIAPIQSDYELLVQRLLGTVQPVQPRVQECSSIADMEVLLQSMLSLASSGAEHSMFFVRRDGPYQVVNYRVDAVRYLEPGSRQSRIIRNSFQYPCSDSDESDDDVLSVGAVRPLPNTASLDGAEIVDASQRQADVVDDVLFMRAQGLIDSPGACCAWMDDFDWVASPYVRDLGLAERDLQTESCSISFEDSEC